MFSHLLVKAGLQVTPHTLATAEAAVEYLSDAIARSDPQAIPTAMFAAAWLPGINGFDLLKWVRQQPPLQNMAFIMLSGSGEPRDLGKATRLGADCYLIKFPSLSGMRTILAEIEKCAALPPPRPVFGVPCNLLGIVSRV